jgi:alpha-beta hydrolase superfamily lysophospholipase
MRRRLIRISLVLSFPPLLAAGVGWLAGPGFLYPSRREFTPDLIREADASFAATGAQRQDFDVRAPDSVRLRGWKVTPLNPNGSWVLLFHGVADNRVGTIGQSQFLLRAGYGVVMMDARAHGASGGSITTYGWLERNDTRAIIDALLSSERDKYVSVQFSGPHPPGSPADGLPPFHLFALGESLGAGIALQSAAADPRIEAVVAEAPFASLREATYDYAGLQKSPLLGKTLFAPGAWTMLYRGQSIAGFPAAEVAPEKSVAARAFPVLLICDTADVVLPCRHAERIYAAARGPKQLWVVPRAFHTSALGFQPEEFRRRVLSFFAAAASSNLTSTRKRQAASTSFTMRQRESESPLPQAAGRKPQGVRFAVVDIGEGAGADVSQSGQFCEMFRRILCR